MNFLKIAGESSSIDAAPADKCEARTSFQLRIQPFRSAEARPLGNPGRIIEHFRAFQDCAGGGRLKSVQCHGRTTEWTNGTGTGEDAATKTMAAATTATGAAECMTTHMGQLSESDAAGWTCAT